MGRPAISVQGVSKRFRLYHERPSSLKERLLRMRSTRAEDFWALRDIVHDVPAGQTLGLVGANGSGKTTLLKIIGGILRPTDGHVTTRGRIAALLELGAGFHPELTGRENVYLNASVLGLSKRETDRYFDDIVGFSELERFIDNQVKFYSSGMFVRLGFSVAVHVNPDILLVDEVLAVGDEGFQRKCIKRVKEFQRDGRTIVFVTHTVDTVRDVCNDAVMLDRGRVRIAGDVNDVLREFRLHLLKDRAGLARADVTKEVEITGVELVDADGKPASMVRPGDPLTVQVEIRVTRAVPEPVVTLSLHDAADRLIYGTNTDRQDVPIDGREGAKQRVTFSLRTIPLLEGRHFVSVSVRPRDRSHIYDWHDQQYRFEMGSAGETMGRLFIPTDISVEPL